MRLLAAWLAIVSSSAVSAEPGDADADFRRARTLLAEQRYAEACPLFERSHALEPALGTLLNVADCSEKLQRWGRAYRAFVEAARWSKRNDDRKREEVARARAQALKTRVVLLAIDVDQPQAVVELHALNGSSTSLHLAIDAFEPIGLDPGPYLLKVMAPGRVPYEKRLEFSRVGEMTVLASLPAVPSPPVEVVAVPQEPRPLPPPPVPALSPMFWVGAVGGGVLVVAGGIGWGFSQSVMIRVARQQPGGPDAAAPTATRREFDTASVLYPVSVGVVAVGVGLVIVGVVTRHPPSQVSFLLSPRPGGLVAGLGGTF